MLIEKRLGLAFEMSQGWATGIDFLNYLMIGADSEICSALDYFHGDGWLARVMYAQI